MKHIEKLTALHAELLEANPYCYFEIAYTRQTGWMAWICSNMREHDPSREIHARGQGETADEAAENALKYYQENTPASDPKPKA